MCENIFQRAMATITDKGEHFDDAIREIKLAYNGRNINTESASNLDFSRLSIRCAYVYRHFTCIVIMTRRLWGRVYEARTEVQSWVKSIKARKSVDVCSLGGGPGTDLIAFKLFLKLNKIANVRVNGVVFDKYVEWEDVCGRLVSQFGSNNANEVFRVDYKRFGVFDEPVRNDVASAIERADVVSIVKFVSAVGYDRGRIRVAMAKLLKFVKNKALVIFVDNSDGEYAELMKMAAVSENLRLIGELSRKKMRVPAGERREMDKDLYKNCGPQKNAMFSACVWIKN